MFRKYEPSGARTAAMLSATSLNQSEYFSGGTGVKPLLSSYSRWLAYGGDVMTRLVFTSASSCWTTSRSRQSPQIRRCPAMHQTSPARVTGSAGGSGIGSSSASTASGTSASASSTRNSSSLNPSPPRSISASLSSANSARSKSSSKEESS